MKDLPEIFKNERVSASAGSGKTYALTSRFIALALRETDPETNLPDPAKIAALTFTRKSAGEFLGKILTRLAEAAQDDRAAAALSDEIERLSAGGKSGGGYITREDAMRLLRQCVRNLDKLRLSTIDSFFSSVLKIFSNELAIFSEIKILDAFAQKAEESKVADEILRDNTVDAKTSPKAAQNSRKRRISPSGATSRKSSRPTKFSSGTPPTTPPNSKPSSGFSKPTDRQNILRR